MSFGILTKLLLVSCNFKPETPPDFERKGVSVIHLNELVSQFLRARTLSNLLLAWGRARDGGVAVTVGVMSAVLVGVLAIAIDLGRAYNLSTELDIGADAYALARPTQIDHSPGSCVRAMQAAINANLANRETFASNPLRADPNIDPTLNASNNSNIRFMGRMFDRAICGTTNEEYVVPARPKSCRHVNFGQVGWSRTATITRSSSWRGGGSDPTNWCNELTAGFVGSRSIGPNYDSEILGIHTESNKDWKSYTAYKYHCTVKIDWEPVYEQRTDAKCGLWPAEKALRVRPESS